MRTRFLPVVLVLACITGLLVPALTAGSPDPIEGVWTGTVGSPQGETAGISFEFFRDEHGTLTVRFDFPAMFTHAASLGIPVESDGAGNYAITPALGIRLRLEDDLLSGTFTAAALPLRLQRGGRLSSRPEVGSSRVDLQACKLEYSIVSPK